MEVERLHLVLLRQDWWAIPDSQRLFQLAADKYPEIIPPYPERLLAYWRVHVRSPGLLVTVVTSEDLIEFLQIRKLLRVRSRRWKETFMVGGAIHEVLPLEFSIGGTWRWRRP